MSKRTVVGIILWLLFLVPEKAYAQHFTTGYATTYRLTNDIETLVTTEITLTNEQPNYYATDYTLLIGSTRLTNITAEIGSEIQPVTVNQTANQTKIDIHFTRKVVGLNQRLIFKVNYKTTDFASQTGQLLYIRIPQIVTKEEPASYRTELVVPLHYGQPTFISPQPENTTQTAGWQSYRFADKKILDQSLVALFGQKQIFDFQLKYALENPHSYPVRTEIALVPDTHQQTVSYRKIDPLPAGIYRDGDGNWLARYFLDKNQSLMVEASGQAQVSYTPDRQPALNPNLPEYLAEQPFWPVNTATMGALVRTINTPEKIYQYVADTLDYDYQRAATVIDRQGAAWALDHPNQAVCMEFTDLFVTLSRAAGIPAREVNGYAYTENPALRPLSLSQDILHAWPQYFDRQEKIWVDVDPTWGKTSGGIDYFHNRDLNRIAFVTHGLDSRYPPPAGSYKTGSGVSKDIDISFGREFTASSSYRLTTPSLPPLYSGFRQKVSVPIINTGSTAWYQLPVSYALGGHRENLTIGFLPPFTTYELEVPVHLPANQALAVILEVTLPADTGTFRLLFRPWYYFLWENKVVAGSLAVFVVCLILAKLNHRAASKCIRSGNAER